ncbi:MAG TPA: hypothetical protein DE179_13715 [Oceanospirillaceae bacterium]|nr:hypothetical protein [Oceanospirillaceae bacterium]
MDKARGFGLLEVNLAIAILALGLSAMMTSYLSVTQTIKMSQQTQRAHVIMAQLSQVLPLYADQLAWLVAQPRQPQTAPSTCWQGGYCNDRQMLAAWWHYWQSEVAAQLADGQLQLTCPTGCAGGGLLQMQIRWRGSDAIVAACNGWHCVTLAWPL